MNNLRDIIQYSINHTLRLILKHFKQISARLRDQRFYCRALKGDSDTNISINCDLSVDCNCYNIDGHGKIGDLRKQSLQEIFSGNKAASFRLMLAKGKFPILDCAKCADLRKVKKQEAEKYIYDYKTPRGIVIENTSLCNLHCLSCNRGKIHKNRAKHSLSLDDIRHVAKCLRENKIRIVSYFNWGEPFFSKTIKEELQILKKENPSCKICISTNGNLIDSHEKLEACLYADHIYFSLDGATNEIANKYQRGTDFNKVLSNMTELAKYKKLKNKKLPIIEWKYILFRWNDSKKSITEAISLAKKADIDKISFWTTLSPIYGISFRHILRNINNFASVRSVDVVIFHKE